MKNSDILKTILIIPLVIGFGIAMMILSYMLVPAFIVGIVGLIVYSFVMVSKEFDDEEDED